MNTTILNLDDVEAYLDVITDLGSSKEELSSHLDKLHTRV